MQPSTARLASLTRLGALALLACVLAGGAARAQAPALDEELLVILEVRLDGAVLSPGVLGYQSPAGPLLPLGALADLMELAVDVEPRTGRAEGWTGDEARRFRLDLRAGTVTVAGATTSLDPGTAVAGDDDIYVTAENLARWFPVDAAVNLGQLLVKLTAREPLPVQKRRRREALRAEQLARRLGHPDFPLEKAAYRGFTWPLLDLNLEYRGRSDAMRPLAAVQASADVAGLAAAFHANHDGGRTIGTARLRLGRTDADAELLGPLAATRFEFGDLYAPSTPLVLRGKLGRGVGVDNLPLRQPDRYDATEIAGDGPPGWEVELYANGVLLEVGEVDAEGRYLFADVPLLFGRNEFRSVLYGPQGQTREHVRTVTVGGEMIPRGAVRYRLFAVQDERSLLVDDALLAATPDRGRWTTHAEAGVGLLRNLSLGGAVTASPVDGEDHAYRTLGLQTVLRGLHVQTTWVDDVDGGDALGFNAQGYVFGRTLNASHERFRDFRSDANDLAQRRTAETRLRLGGNARWRGRGLAYDLKYQHTSYEERGILSQDLVAARAATSVGRTQLNTRVDWRRSEATAGGYDRVAADQMLSGSLGPVLVRGSVRWGFAPASRLESFAASAAWRPARDVRVGGRVQRNLVGVGATTVGASLTLLLDSFQLSLNVSDTSRQKPWFGVSITTSLTRVPDTGRVHVQRQRMSAGYGATARVFLDRNANGLFDDADDPLPGVQLDGTGLPGVVATDKRGQVFVGGLPAHRERDITLDVDSIDDPYLLPSISGRRATGHPGAHVVLDFPVTFAGDVEGTVYAQTAAGKVPVRGVALELVDLTDRTLRTAVSEFDGYYLFQEVPPGWYEVRVVPESLTRKNLRVPAPVAVSIAADGGVSAGNDFTLRPVRGRVGMK